MHNVSIMNQRKVFNYSIIRVHAPIEENNKEEKMPFMMTWIRPMRSAM
jgi:hypothetical protein